MADLICGALVIGLLIYAARIPEPSEYERQQWERIMRERAEKEPK